MPPTLENPTAWRYWQCSLNTPAEAFGPFSRMVDLWRSKSPGPGKLPNRSAFDFIDFRGWWGRTAIARIERAPFDVRFTLWGTQLTEWWGTDYTNRRVGEDSKNPEAWQKTEVRYFRSMAVEPHIGVASGGLDQHGRPFIKVLGLDLPLGNGLELTHVLALHIEIEAEAGPADVLPGCALEPILFD